MRRSAEGWTHSNGFPSREEQARMFHSALVIVKPRAHRDTPWINCGIDKVCLSFCFLFPTSTHPRSYECWRLHPRKDSFNLGIMWSSPTPTPLTHPWASTQAEVAFMLTAFVVREGIDLINFLLLRCRALTGLHAPKDSCIITISLIAAVYEGPALESSQQSLPLSQPSLSGGVTLDRRFDVSEPG